MIKIIGLKKDYVSRKRTVNAIKNLSIEFKKNEFVAILGKSGCGKSTLLNILAGLTDVTQGSIIVDEIDITKLSKNELVNYRKDNVGIILQDSALLDNFTVFQNIELPLKIRKIEKNERKKKIEELISELDIINIKDKFPSELSGGQKQRVAIARAIIYEPTIILADEPTGSLDDENAYNIISILKKLSKKSTILMVTHNIEIAKKCDRIIQMKDGELL